MNTIIKQDELQWFDCDLHYNGKRVVRVGITLSAWKSCSYILEADDMIECSAIEVIEDGITKVHNGRFRIQIEKVYDE